MEQETEIDPYKKRNLDYDKVACQIDIQTCCYAPFYLFLVLKTEQTAQFLLSLKTH